MKESWEKLIDREKIEKERNRMKKSIKVIGDEERERERRRKDRENKERD